MPDLTIPPTASGSLNPSAALPTTSDDVELEQFIAAHDLRADLDRAIAMTREAFPSGSRVVVRLQYLADHEELRVVVDARLSLDVTDAVERHEKLLDRWTLELPLRAQGLLITTFTRV